VRQDGRPEAVLAAYRADAGRRSAELVSDPA
jgi:hypothetical protein